MAARFAQEPPPELALPAAVARSLFDQGAPPEIGLDQVWQLRWQSEVCLVATVAVNGWHVTVAPVTTDVHLAGADTAVFDAGSSPLQVPTAVWLSVTATVPTAAFARAIGAFAWPEGSGVLREAALSVRRTGAVGSSQPHGIQGQESNVDTIEIADVLQHRLAWFASADRALAETLSATGDSAQSVDVVLLLRGLSSTQLAQAGVRKAELIPVIRGGQLTAVQAVALAPILGLDPATLLGGGSAVPEPLIEEASSPRWFHPRQAFARANKMSDVDGLADITSKAQFALAARAPGVTPGATNCAPRSRGCWPTISTRKTDDGQHPGRHARPSRCSTCPADR